MEIIRSFTGINTKPIQLKKESIIETWLFIAFLAFLIVTRSSYHPLFHTSAELYTCAVAFGLFFIALNTITMSENNFIVFLGIGYFFAGIIDMLHIFTYSGVSLIYAYGNQSMVVQFWIASRYLTAITLLDSTLLLYRNIKKFKIYHVFFSYLFLCCLIILSIMYFKVFPQCYIIGEGLTQFKIISEYIICFAFLLVAILYFNMRKNMDKKLFFYMECHLLSIAVSEMLFSSFFSPFDWRNICAHIIRVIAYLFLYKAIIETGLRRPWVILYNKMDKIDKELHITAGKLEEEQQQRRMMEEMLLKNEQCYELIINNSSDAIIVTRKDQCIFANERAAEILGADKPSDLIGKKMFDFIHPEERDTAIENTKELILNAVFPARQEYKVLSSTGNVYDVELISDHFSYQGKQSYISIFRDISTRKQIIKLEDDMRDNERALKDTKEYNKLLTEFFSNISHELKTPLNVILGAIQVLTLPEKAALPREHEIKMNKYLRLMKQNCYRLLRLVNNLIDLSKFDSGYSKLNLRNLNIVSIVEEIIQSVVAYVENQGLEIVFDTDVEEKVTAVDADKIERIILNLLSNSMKFTDKGGRITVDMRDMQDRIAISVKDTGIGIPKDKLNTILDRFGQVDKSLTRNREGSGIGLSLVKTLVEMHGGTIKISSIEGEGSEVNIELPVRTVETETAESDSPMYRNNIERISIEFSDIYSE